MNELDIINNYLKPLVKNNEAALNLDDDVGFIKIKNSNNLLITTDTIVENIHFFTNDSPKSIAHKLIAVNLSDLASKGATPKYFTMNFSPKSIGDLPSSWFDEFFSTLASMQTTYKIELIGGDTTITKGAMVISITMIGEVNNKAVLPFRFNAKEEDLIFCTGHIGDSYFGYNILAYNKKLINKPVWLDLLNTEDIEYFINKYYFPIPRVEIGKRIAEIATACADISDGLLKDLYNICEASKVTAKIKLEEQLFSKSALKIVKHMPSLMLEIISGGDDYELIFTINPKNNHLIEKLKSDIGLNITFLGNIKLGSNSNVNKQVVKVLDVNGSPIEYKFPFGYLHN